MCESYFMMRDLTIESVLGAEGVSYTRALRTGLAFLDNQTTAGLLARVGRRIDSVALPPRIPKRSLPIAYGGGEDGPTGDFLVGRGLFYLDEQRRLFLDCTSGHYQMLWGYNHPALCAAMTEGVRDGIVWDNHSNIPQAPLKLLAARLVDLANDPSSNDPLDTVLLGVCTGSVACAAALKIQLKVFERHHPPTVAPVIITLAGNYHGTDLVPQFMRGLWPRLVRPFDMVQIEPNDQRQLEHAFEVHRGRVAGFWAEPVMMNREAIALDADYLKRARQLCDREGALLCLDEIQTGFWCPEVFACRALSLRPDLIVLGKGLTAGFHPLSGVLFRRRHDLLEQYDAISTNGSAALPAYVALASLEMIHEQGPRIRAVAQSIQAGFHRLVQQFPNYLEAAHGTGHLAGLKFHSVETAKAFHRSLLEAGLWTRVHAYHEGHRTILTKLGLPAEAEVVDFMLATFERLLHALRSR